ncbi:MAG TPA: NUDIX hydrolase [Candidatus Saccharimonadia bacterium]|nr:NUDIX hydrolase [Candidatus Saccharimonadia bacterium]
MTEQLRLAACIIPNDKGEILLLHRNTPKRTQWEVPGGKIDEIVDGAVVSSGRTELETVVREISEELGVTVSVARQLGAKEFTEDSYAMHYSWFLGVITNGEPTIGEPDKYDDLRYFNRETLAKMRKELSGNTQNFLDAWTAKEFTLDATDDTA